jgi:hypothetical protein
LLKLPGGLEPRDDAAQALNWRTVGERSWGLTKTGVGERPADPTRGEKGPRLVNDWSGAGKALAQGHKNRTESHCPAGGELSGRFVAVEDHAEGEELECVFSTTARCLGESLADVTGVAVEKNSGAAFDARDPFGREFGDV